MTVLGALNMRSLPAVAGETPLCSVNDDGECTIGAPQSSQYCAGQQNSADCPRFQDFTALYMRGEEELQQRRADATAATNSLVFNAFIWLQVRPLMRPFLAISIYICWTSY